MKNNFTQLIRALVNIILIKIRILEVNKNNNFRSQYIRFNGNSIFLILKKKNYKYDKKCDLKIKGICCISIKKFNSDLYFVLMHDYTANT